MLGYVVGLVVMLGGELSFGGYGVGVCKVFLLWVEVLFGIIGFMSFNKKYCVVVGFFGGVDLVVIVYLLKV